MYPELRYQLMQAQIADLHARARCDALARASRRAQRSQPTDPAARLPAAALIRRRLTALGARNSAWVAPRSRRMRSCAINPAEGRMTQAIRIGEGDVR
jgi:hypothetical protein